MPCYHPLRGYASKHVNPTGKRSVVFKLSQGIVAKPVTVPCGRCIGCRLELSRQWAVRCMHEAQLHQESCFITLTYDNDHVPYGGTLIKKHYQDFMKRLRKRACGEKIKYYHCGEYGGQTRRPHYHALIFGLDFPDKLPFKKSADGSPIYTSELLERLWGKGFCTTGAVTFESAAYVARYTTTKLNSDKEFAYEFIDLDTGEVVPVQPEYTTMSLNPAIAKDWYAQFKRDVFPADDVVLRGRQMKPPKYYDRLLELEDPAARALVKERRMQQALLRSGDATKRRLADRETVKLAQFSQLKRGMT